MKKYFAPVSEKMSHEWLENHKRVIPEIHEGDTVRLMPVWFTYFIRGKAYACMKYDRNTLEPKAQEPTLTRISENRLLVWDIRNQNWLIFTTECLLDDNSKKIQNKYSPYKEWLN